MTENQDEGKTAEWWRWALVPIACLAGASASALLFYWIERLEAPEHWEPSSAQSLGAAPIFVAGIFGYAYSWIAYRVSPYAKFKAGGIMLGMLALIAAAGVTLTWTILKVESPWVMTGAALVMLGTATASLFHEHAMATNPEAVYRDRERYRRSWWRLLDGSPRRPWWWWP